MKYIKIILATYAITKNRDAFPLTREFMLPDGITVGEFFNMQFAGRKADQYFIRVNKQSVQSKYVLKDGDKISITPTNLEKTSTLTVSTSGTASSDSFDFENEVDPGLLELEEKVKKLME